MEKAMEQNSYSKGLEGIIADESRICKIDGINGRLYYRGYSIEDLPPTAAMKRWRSCSSMRSSPPGLNLMIFQAACAAAVT